VILTLAVLLGLARACAPAVAPETLLSVARAESGFDPFVVAANTTPRRVFHPASADAATAIAGALIRAGRSVDLGLGQINSRTLAGLGLGLADAFDPCRNLATSARVLEDGYLRAAPAPGDEQTALRTALSRYNTGDPQRGIRNGYVARVTRAAREVVPAIAPDPPPAPRADDGPAPPAPAPSLDIFARPAAAAVEVFEAAQP
jgi:type IV secretion system protein VirB1